MNQAYQLTASVALAQIRNGSLTIEQYALSLLGRIEERDPVVHAWVYLDREHILEQAKALDKVPMEQRGPLHGLPVGVKDVIYTKDMPTKHGSAIYEDSFPKVDAGSVAILRAAGALIFGKLTTTEFASGTTAGTATRNAHSQERTPGGSSSGPAAAVADFQIPVALGTQTSGSIVRPGSFNGVYAVKPTWNSISREGQRISSLIFDTLGFFARSVEDLALLADAFDLDDAEESHFSGVRGARFAVCKTVVWPKAGKGTIDALAKAVELLKANGAIVEELELPSAFDKLPEWHHHILNGDTRTNLFPEDRMASDKLHQTLLGVVVNHKGVARKQYLEAFDGMAALRPKIDDIAEQYAAILTPSVPDEAPLGLESTGSPAFCESWSSLHTPVINLPGFSGPNEMPVGVSLVAPRFRDKHLLKVAEEVGKILETQGGWDRHIQGRA